MRIKMLKPWQMVSAGSIQEFPAPIACELIRTGRAKEVQPQAPAPTGKLKQRKKDRKGK